MKGVNLVVLYGNLGRDIELKQSGGGLAIAEMSVATNQRKKKGDEWVDHTEWHTVVAFGKTAEACAQYRLWFRHPMLARFWRRRTGLRRLRSSSASKAAGQRTIWWSAA